MHQLPISVQCVVLAVGQKAKFSVKLFWKVAQAVHETPPAVDYTRFAVLVMADVAHTQASLKLQVCCVCMGVTPDMLVTASMFEYMLLHACMSN